MLLIDIMLDKVNNNKTPIDKKGRKACLAVSELYKSQEDNVHNVKQWQSIAIAARQAKINKFNDFQIQRWTREEEEGEVQLKLSRREVKK